MSITDPDTVKVILDNINYASVAVNAILAAIVSYFFIRYFTEKRLPAVLGMIFFHIPSIAWQFMDDSEPLRVLFAASQIFFCFLTMYLVERIRPAQKFLISLMLYTFRWLSVLISSEIQFPVSSYVFSNPKWNIIEWLIPEYVLLILLEHIIFTLYFVMLSVLYHRFYGEKEYEPNFIELLILSMPALSRAIDGKLYRESYDIYTNYFNSLVRLDDTDTLQTISWGSYTRIAESLVSSVFILALVYLFQKSRRLADDLANERLLAIEVENTKERIRHIESLYRDMRSIKHDMRHQIRLLNDLVEAGRVTEAAEGLDSLVENISDAISDISTGHPVTDILLTDMRDEAARAGIDFSTDFAYSEETGIDVFDISMLLSNALQNAIDASKGFSEAHIFVSSQLHQNVLLITVKNTYLYDMPKALCSHGEASPRGLHGYGIPNMKRIAKKYLGDISYEKSGDEIIFTAMLECPIPLQ